MKKLFLSFAAISCIISSCSKAELPVDAFVGTYDVTGKVTYSTGRDFHDGVVTGTMAAVPTGNENVWVKISIDKGNMPFSTFSFNGIVENGTLKLEESVKIGVSSQATVTNKGDGSLSIRLTSKGTYMIDGYDTATLEIVAEKE